MKKRIIAIAVMIVMAFGIFGLAGCDNVSLADYKTTKIQALQDYADAKGESNYSETGWAAVCNAVTEGKTEIAKATSTGNVDAAYKAATDAVDAVAKEDEMNDFEFTVAIDKTIVMVGDKITVVLQLKNLSDDDVLLEIPDWIAAEGGHELKDILVSFCLPVDSGFDWEIASVAIEPRPRIIFGKKSFIEKEVEFIVSESTDLEIFAGAFFYIGNADSSRFTKQITLTKSSTKIQIEG